MCYPRVIFVLSLSIHNKVHGHHSSHPFQQSLATVFSGMKGMGDLSTISDPFEGECGGGGGGGVENVDPAKESFISSNSYERFT